ncbi:MAG: hypothetical protein Q7J84_00005 [Sulfuricaulis sp.]|nr:hypothetical protein [Sulfuricaulis sp.]
MNEDKTLPPLGARTPRNLFRWLKAWAKAEPITATAILCLLAGFIIGAWLL